MIQLINAAIAATEPGGSTARLFERDGSWEGPLRHDFRAMRELVTQNREEAVALAVSAYRQLDKKYHGTRKPPDYPLLVQETFRAIDRRGWWSEGSPSLFETHPNDIGIISQVVSEILRGIKNQNEKLKDPKLKHQLTYVLLTKILHFTFPETFVIYDNRAAMSLETWEVRDAGDLRKEDCSTLNLRVDDLGETSGVNYGRIVCFYRKCWTFARTAKLDAKWGEAAGRMSDFLRTFPGSEGAVVSRLDVLDKLLYVAWGDASKLGF